MVGHLKNIDIGELSLTKGKGANKKKYAFIKSDEKRDETIVKIIKADLSVTIKSDGTAEGTKVRVNGKAIEGLKDFSFNLYKSQIEGIAGEFGVEPAMGGSVSCSYTLEGKEKNGFMVSNRYYLMKNDMEVKEEMKVKELLKQYFGEDVELKKEESEAIEKSLEVINEYKESFPEELKKSVGIVMKNALLESEVKTSEESEGEPKDKADVKKKESVKKKDDEKVELSEDKISEIVKAVMKGLVPEKKEESKEEGKEETVITKKLDEIKEGISKKDESIGKLTERLEAVEKIKGIKKQIDGQEEEGEDGADGKKKVLWKSFQGK